MIFFRDPPRSFKGLFADAYSIGALRLLVAFNRYGMPIVTCEFEGGLSISVSREKWSTLYKKKKWGSKP